MMRPFKITTISEHVKISFVFHSNCLDVVAWMHVKSLVMRYRELIDWFLIYLINFSSSHCSWDNDKICTLHKSEDMRPIELFD